MISVCMGTVQLHDGDCFEAKDKTGAVNYYRIESATAKHGQIYVTLRAVGETLDRIREEVEHYNKLNWRFPMKPDALDTMEVETAWFDERKLRKMEGTK